MRSTACRLGPAFLAGGILLTCTSNRAFAQAQGSETITTTAEAVITRLNGPVTFDGVMDEAVWNAITPLPLIQYEPNTGSPITEATVVRLGYDDEFFYLAVRCDDSSGITETTFRRDNWTSSDDQVALMLDTFNDYESGKAFVLYASGARIDAELANDGRSMSDVNTDWNGFWEGKVSRDEGGWSAEIRVPISTLRFQPGPDGKTTMGLIFYRYVARTTELQIFPEIPPNWGFWSFLKPSKSERVTFDGLKQVKPLYVSPYVIGGLGQNFDLNEAETEYIRSDDPTYDVGFDLKYSLSSNMTLDLTVNTDFAQVEADNQQVNLTRFSLFFPEKRQFFLERTSNFDFGFGDDDRVFYSRRIGLEDGQQVALLGGGRVVGRTGGWDIGLLSIQSARQDGIPSRNASVVRLKRRVLNNNSYAGGIATSRIDEDGNYNIAFGADAVVNVWSDDYVGLAWAQTHESDAGAVAPDLEASRIRLFAQRPREVGVGYDVALSRAGANYDPGLGFQSRSDFSHVSAKASYGVRPGEQSVVQRHFLTAENDVYFRNVDGSLETSETELEYEISTKTGYTARASGTFVYEDLTEGFDLSDDAGIPAGTYRFGSGGVYLETPTGNKVMTELELGGGTFYDGTVASVSLSPRVSVSSNLLLSGSYAYNRIRFADRDESFDAHLVSGRLDVMMNTKLSVAAFVQYSSSGNVLLSNVRFRFNPREGNDFYLVYNEGFNTNRLSSMPQLPVSSSRVVVAKYTHTFRFE